MSEYKIYPGHEIFPIKTDSACILKWSWSTINLETAQTSSCHRTKMVPIDPDNFKNFHNHPSKIQDREHMLNEEWPDSGRGCEYCKNVEDHGGTSDRQLWLSRLHGANKIPPELFDQPRATHVTPTILEVYFNKTCNLSCVYCHPSVSSKWNEEVSKFGEIKIKDFSITEHHTDKSRYKKMVQGLWDYLIEDDRYKIIQHYQLLGGESLLQKELDDSIDFWKTHPNPSLTFNIISNIMVPHHLFVDKIQKFQDLVDANAIYQLELTASLDCWGGPQEYVRHGIDLDVWTKNFEYLLDKSWILLSIHSCITSLTIKTMPDLLEKILFWNSTRPTGMPVDLSFDFVNGEDGKKNGLHPSVFGPGVFDDDLQRILQLLPENNEHQISLKKHMQGSANLIENSVKNVERIDVLKEYLTELDRRRNTNWREVFPWLTKF